jgi:hypothetical protein
MTMGYWSSRTGGARIKVEPTWTFNGEAMRSADEVYHQQLPPIDVTAFSAGFPVQQGQAPLLPHREQREIYADSLFDLSRLLEEVRFEVALAVMLLVDFRVHRDLGEVKVQNAPSRDTGMPMQILAVLMSYAAPPPAPTALLRSLHQPMSGYRYLSRWLAAQLLDSAILRALSCMDRVVAMLHLRAGLAVKKRKDGTLHLPAFTRQDLRVLRSVYEQQSAWGEFKAILDHPVYGLIKRFRDGMVHHRRWPSELHGESQVSYWDAGGLAVDGGGPEQVYQGLRAQDHVALLAATWNEVIGPTVELGGRLLSPPSKGGGRSSAEGG